MKIDRKHKSKTYSKEIIDPKFVVIHYTACPLKETLKILCEKKHEVSAHFVISEKGEIFELVPCLEKGPFKAWHAGKSSLKVGKKILKSFNDFSIGIELVNLNGNAFPYTKKQYQSLVRLLKELIKKFPDLNQPKAIIGHEEIAGFRGKVDPGHLFDWKYVYSKTFKTKKFPKKKPALSKKIQAKLVKLKKVSPLIDWAILNSELEKVTAK